MSARRVVLAFVFTPLVAPFYAAILFAQPWALPVGLSASYSCALLIGIPTFLFLRRRAWTSCWHFILGGMLCGIPTVAAYSIGAPSVDIEPLNAVSAATIMAWSAFSGFCFWLVGIAGDAPVTLRTLLNPDLSPEERSSPDTPSPWKSA